MGRPVEARGQEAKPLVTMDLTGAVGQEVLVLTVEHGPGDSGPVHRHNAQAFVYLLEGSVVMQVQGQPPVALKAGDTSFYEGRDDVHQVGRTVSPTNRASFVAFLVKEDGAPGGNSGPMSPSTREGADPREAEGSEGGRGA